MLQAGDDICVSNFRHVPNYLIAVDAVEAAPRHGNIVLAHFSCRSPALPTSPPYLQSDIASHAVIAQVWGHHGADKVRLGAKGVCRFCGSDDARKFRNESHALPEALGNRWIVALDECDDCNERFAKYDAALAMSIGSVLTVGGTRGKGNQVRQTGRSKGPIRIRHSKEDGRRRLSIVTSQGGFTPDITGQRLRMETAAPTERFIPAHAYRALVKYGLGVMPHDELARFANLRQWLLDGAANLPNMIVGLSFGSVGNAPEIASATLLRRQADTGPYMILVVTVGSACFQLDLKSDDGDGVWPPLAPVLTSIRWRTVISDGAGDAVAIPFGRPQHLDWSSSALELTPVETIVTEVDMAANTATITPVLRPAER